MLSNLSPEWLELISDNKDELDEIVKKIKIITPQDSKLCPQPTQWFEWCRLTPLEDVRVVLIGMDPYPNPAHAHGLSFSSLDTKIPSSLQNIYKCLVNTKVIDKIPIGANLTGWAKQGVLCLNVGLSTEEKKTGAHLKLWQPFTTQLIQSISKWGCDKSRQLIFILWGKQSQLLDKYIDVYHHIMKWCHPSPLAQTRLGEEEKFINCPHFRDINKILSLRGDTTINWYSSPEKNDSSSEAKVEEAKVEEAKVEDKKPETKEPMPIIKINKDDGLKPQPNIIKVFTDGSCLNNSGKNCGPSISGYSVLWVQGPWADQIILGNLDNTINPTNIRAEGMAIWKILEILHKDIKAGGSAWSLCTIYTDSEFWLKMFKNYMPRWSKEKFTSKANPDMTSPMWELWNEINLARNIDIVWVPAHSTVWSSSTDPYKKFCYNNNNSCDILAQWARINLCPGETKII